MNQKIVTSIINNYLTIFCTGSTVAFLWIIGDDIFFNTPPEFGYDVALFYVLLFFSMMSIILEIIWIFTFLIFKRTYSQKEVFLITLASVTLAIFFEQEIQQFLSPIIKEALIKNAIGMSIIFFLVAILFHSLMKLRNKND